MTQKGEVVHLVEACSKSGCPVCTLIRDEIDRFFDHMLYNRVTELELRTDIRAAWGFCNRHAHMLIRPGGSVGAAVIYEDVLKNLQRALDAATWQDGGWRRRGGAISLVERLKPRHECVGCVHQRDTERAYIRALVRGLGDERPAVEEFVSAYGGSEGLCLRHLRMAMAKARRRETFETLVRAQQAAWERLCGELAEFIRKNDYRFRHEPMGPEGDSWQRVIWRVAGEPGIGGEEDRAH